MAHGLTRSRSKMADNTFAHCTAIYIYNNSYCARLHCNCSWTLYVFTIKFYSSIATSGAAARMDFVCAISKQLLFTGVYLNFYANYIFYSEHSKFGLQVSVILLFCKCSNELNNSMQYNLNGKIIISILTSLFPSIIIYTFNCLLSVRSDSFDATHKKYKQLIWYYVCTCSRYYQNQYRKT